LPRAVSANGLDGHVIGVKTPVACNRESEAWWHTIFKYFKRQGADAGLKRMGFVMIAVMTDVRMPVRVAMVMAAAA
jgi:hypothetical protein